MLDEQSCHSVRIRQGERATSGSLGAGTRCSQDTLSALPCTWAAGAARSHTCFNSTSALGQAIATACVLVLWVLSEIGLNGQCCLMLTLKACAAVVQCGAAKIGVEAQ